MRSQDYAVFPRSFDNGALALLVVDANKGKEPRPIIAAVTWRLPAPGVGSSLLRGTGVGPCV
jgi:hypothetical protein